MDKLHILSQVNKDKKKSPISIYILTYWKYGIKCMCVSPMYFTGKYICTNR